jgi:hypothetical protein
VEIVHTVTNTIVDDYASDAFNSELILRKLITLDLENIKKALVLKIRIIARIQTVNMVIVGIK